MKKDRELKKFYDTRIIQFFELTKKVICNDLSADHLVRSSFNFAESKLLAICRPLKGLLSSH